MLRSVTIRVGGHRATFILHYKSTSLFALRSNTDQYVKEIYARVANPILQYLLSRY